MFKEKRDVYLFWINPDAAGYGELAGIYHRAYDLIAKRYASEELEVVQHYISPVDNTVLVSVPNNPTLATDIAVTFAIHAAAIIGLENISVEE